MPTTKEDLQTAINILTAWKDHFSDTEFKAMSGELEKENKKLQEQVDFYKERCKTRDEQLETLIKAIDIAPNMEPWYSYCHRVEKEIDELKMNAR